MKKKNQPITARISLLDEPIDPPIEEPTPEPIYSGGDASGEMEMMPDRTEWEQYMAELALIGLGPGEQV